MARSPAGLGAPQQAFPQRGNCKCQYTCLACHLAAPQKSPLKTKALLLDLRFSGVLQCLYCISKNYNRYSALRGVNLELEPGLYGLLGPNGAGKSTLLKIIAGILRPTAGSILLDNEPVSKLGEHYRAMLGYMPQDLGIYPEFTAKRYLLYIAALKGLTEAQAKAEIDKLLEAVGLSSNAEQKLKSFSGGMLRRVGIAQTLLCNPQILLLDEPTAGLDPQERVRLRNLLSALAQHSIIILSTHIISDVELIAEKIILLREGQIAAFDTVAGLVGKSTLEDVYLTYFQKEA